jgi:hypothetical protein
MSTRVPVGSTITKIYFTIAPYQGAAYTVGPEHEDFVAALDAGVDEFLMQARKTFTITGEPAGDPNHPVVIERWVVRLPDGQLDLPIERTVIDLETVASSKERRGIA